MLSVVPSAPRTTSTAFDANTTYLDHRQPNFLKDSFGDVFLNALNSLGIESSCLARQLGQQTILLLISDLFLKEDLLRLGQHDADQCLDRLPAQIRGGRVEKVLVDVGEHAGRSLERVVCSLESRLLGSQLVCCMAG